MYKKISLRSVPKPGPGNRAGFFIARTRGTPKTPWFLQIASLLDVHPAGDFDE
jgi:hypothetical protein